MWSLPAKRAVVLWSLLGRWGTPFMVTQKNIGTVLSLLRKAIKAFPTPSVTLVAQQWDDPFLVLISCILSLRTQDQTTLPAAHRLFHLGRTPRQILKLSEAQIQKAIYPVGFYRTKSRTIKSICRKLVDEFRGCVPGDLETLLTFKGVGRKTANLVLSEGFHKPAICVDTHVHRISNRFGFVRTRDPHETETALRRKLPVKYWIEYNFLLVTWGQQVCRPISPWCSSCAVLKYCARRGVVQSR